MPYDYESTHRQILLSAMKNFSEVGFRDASIRTICKDAGVTNGAFYAHFKSKDDLFSTLVGDCLNQFAETYKNFSDLKINSAEDVVNIFRNSYVSIETLIHYIYRNHEIFMLILKHSGGSSYESFVDDMIAAEANSTMEFLEKSRIFMKRPENISERIAKTGAALLINTVFDSFAAGESEEENIRNAKLCSEYCIAGYRELLGL